jgi:tetratricopeptide (TPR) repeat protein
METGVIVVFVVVWIAVAAVVATIGNDRKAGYATIFWLSIFLSPIIAILIGLASERKQPEAHLDQDAQRFFSESSQLAKANRREEAITKLKALLAVQPNYALAHYNLACNYSRLGKADDAFRSLTAAVKSGYNNFKKIQSDPDLAFLRSQSGYGEYAASGYREFGASSVVDDVVTKLERLASLKDRGMLTEAEFLEQKAKVLKGS